MPSRSFGRIWSITIYSRWFRRSMARIPSPFRRSFAISLHTGTLDWFHWAHTMTIVRFSLSFRHFFHIFISYLPIFTMAGEWRSLAVTCMPLSPFSRRRHYFVIQPSTNCATEYASFGFAISYYKDFAPISASSSFDVDRLVDTAYLG